MLQEIDIRTGLVMYEWTALDHVGLGESSTRGTLLDGLPVGLLPHQLDQPRPRGSLLVSARNTWTVYELNAASGQIVWQLGGKRSSFGEPAAARTAWQHDRANSKEGSSASSTTAPRRRSTRSRAGSSLKLEPGAKRASVVRELTHSPPLVAESEGDLQLLTGGNWFVGWGQEPVMSEFGPEGALLYEAHLPRYVRSYRDRRFLWSGTPAHSPVFAYQAGGPGAGTVYASWNGATGVASWGVLAGSGPIGTVQVAQAPRSGFETAIPLPAGTVGPFLWPSRRSGAGGQGAGLRRRSGPGSIRTWARVDQLSADPCPGCAWVCRRDGEGGIRTRDGT